MFPIQFTYTESCALRKLNCIHQKSIAKIFAAFCVTYNSLILSFNRLLMAAIDFTQST